MAYLLGIESSCDETAAAVIKDNTIFSNVIANQEVHKAWGGVVPELASRSHQLNIIPVVHKALKDAGINKENIDAVAFTKGPGLIGPLLVGVSFAKAFALGLGIPIIDVNHLQAHVLALFIQKNNAKEVSVPSFPFLCLIVSGGHTQIVLVRDYLEMEITGETKDDAAGEAFDKSAKLLGLPYPGGPMIDLHAKEGNPYAFKFPKSKVPDLDFSFSGLKTAIMNFILEKKTKDNKFIQQNLNDICASVQYTIVRTLIDKLILASEKTRIKEIAIAGGVSANSYLRDSFLIQGKQSGWKTYIPVFEYCTDNAAMVAITGYYKYLKKQFANHHISPIARNNF